MKFDELEARMRAIESANDPVALPDVHMVARIDGRNFTRLTKETHKFEAPYDERFRDFMIQTTGHLMQCGFRILYGYTQSDEISLLFHRDETTFDRKIRKYTSVLAGEASAKFSILLGDVAAFDCRIAQLATGQSVCDYFRWRNEDAHRNALNGHCYWLLRKQGKSSEAATAMLQGASVSEKNDLLFHAGINFNDLPAWQKRGIGLMWEVYDKPARNRKTGEEVAALRRRLKTELNLPIKEEYGKFILSILKFVANPSQKSKEFKQ